MTATSSADFSASTFIRLSRSLINIAAVIKRKKRERKREKEREREREKERKAKNERGGTKKRKKTGSFAAKFVLGSPNRLGSAGGVEGHVTR